MTTKGTSVVSILSTLPVELLCNILERLDPIGLISLSQTCSYFRRLIDPGTPELVQRLLAVESLDEHGGGTPIFRARDNHLSPSWADEKWLAIRWACTGCLRLLSHIHFDNHSLLRLGMRKPLPGSPAAELTTCWKPVQYHKSWVGRVKQHQVFAKEKELRWRYRISSSYETGRFISEPRWTVEDFRDAGVVGLDDLTDEAFIDLSSDERLQILDHDIHSIELERCGYKRHLRKCNECRYRAGKLGRRMDGTGGSATFPIQVSRQLRFHSALERYFPGFAIDPEDQKPASPVPIGQMFREDPAIYQPSSLFLWPEHRHDRVWTLYMARCPQCQKWQELRSFRIGHYGLHWQPVEHAGRRHSEPWIESWTGDRLTPEFLANSLCNQCFAREHGRDSLGEVLQKFFRNLQGRNVYNADWQLSWGWRILWNAVPDLPTDYRQQVEDLLEDTYPLMKSLEEKGVQDLDDSQIRLLELRHGQFAKLWETLAWVRSSKTVRRLEKNAWFQTWLHQFDIIQAYRSWLTRTMAKIESDPSVLVDWALSRDDTSLS